MFEKKGYDPARISDYEPSTFKNHPSPLTKFIQQIVNKVYNIVIVADPTITF